MKAVLEIAITRLLLKLGDKNMKKIQAPFLCESKGYLFGSELLELAKQRMIRETLSIDGILLQFHLLKLTQL